LWKHYMNGVQTSATSTVTPNVPVTRMSIVDVRQPFAGEIYEGIFYDRLLSVAERQQVEAYLTAKWIPPIPMSGLQGWYDAADDASFTYQATPGQIDLWKDKSGNNRHQSHSVPSVNPSRPGTMQNGKKVVVFGAGQSLYNWQTGPWMNNVDNFTMVAAGQRTGGMVSSSMLVNGDINVDGYSLMARAGGPNIGFHDR
jgi:hypothetical protein